MKPEKVTAAVFSPTHGTKRYCTEVAVRLSADYEFLNLADPEVREKEYRFGEKDLVIFGAPVYAGRLPQIPGGIFDRVKGSSTPAIFMVSYGNREYEDALLEEIEICGANGFKAIAAGAWIAPHTFSDKIATGRPNGGDMKKVEAFAEEVKKLLDMEELPEKRLSVPGNHPYRDPKAMPFHPRGSKKCTSCRKCVAVCPVRAIYAENPRETDASRCIDCLACARVCPSGARGITGPIFKIAVSKLESNLAAKRKEPETFILERI